MLSYLEKKCMLARDMLYGRNGVPKDPLKGMRLLEECVQFGHVTAMFKLASILHWEDVGLPKDLPRAKALYERAIEGGNVLAINNLGSLLKDGGEGVEKDLPRAKALFERAVQRGDVMALNNLGILLQDGEGGVVKDLPRAKALYDHAVEKGSVLAMNNLATLLQLGGEGVPKDLSRAKELYELAVKADDVNAMINLGFLLQDGGEGVEKDLPRTKVLLELAAEHGSSQAMTSLGYLLEHGGDGVDIDESRAVMLHRQAANGDNAMEKPRLAKIPLEAALSRTLQDPDLLDESFLVKYIHSTNVTTESDLLAGHNLIMLAIRFGVLTRQDVKTLGSSSGFLKDNLYLPGSKVESEDTVLVNAILQHAEEMEIIESPCEFKVPQENRKNMEEGMRAASRVFEAFAERMSVMDERAGALEEQASAHEANMQMLYEAVRGLAAKQCQLQRAVDYLARSLSRLKESIQKQDTRRKYTSVAHMCLALFPLVGAVVGDTACAGIDLLRVSADDLVQAGIGVSGPVVGGMAPLDLSNFRVVTYAFTKPALARLGAPARKAIISCIEYSPFRSTQELQDVLLLHSKPKKKPASPVTLLNSQNSWNSGCSPSLCAPSMSRLQCQEERVTEPNSQEVLDLKTRDGKQRVEEVSSLEIKAICEEDMSTVSSEQMADLLPGLAAKNEDGLVANMLVELFSAVHVEQQEKDETKGVVKECLDRLRKRSNPRKEMRIRRTAQILSSFMKEREGQGLLEKDSVGPIEKLEEEMRKFGGDNNELINEEELCNALKKILKK